MRRRLLFAYLGLLLLSQLVSLARGPVPPTPPAAETLLAEVPRRVAEQEQTGTMRLAYRDIAATEPGAPTLLLVHGSPGDGDVFDQMVEELRGEVRLIVPDLPGFGSSERVIEDYSFDTHAFALLDLLDRLEVEQVHALGFSMGGGVITQMAAAQPQRIASLTMLAGIGVQELELFGRYELNHAVHGFQLLSFRLAGWLLPHFGALREGNIGRNFARNFYHSDQQPLRAVLDSWPGPALIIHGESDPLVPVAAALEHARIMPQAKAEIWSDANHFLPWKETERVSTALRQFIAEVESGQATLRSDVSAEAQAAALEPWDPKTAPKLAGFALIIMLLLLAAATLISEDLTCIFTGLLVAQGRIGFFPGSMACFFGILIGDSLLFLLGRWLGQPALARAPLRWLVRPSAVYRASSWFEHRGGKVIMLSRFLPGLRLPTYVAAGMLGQRFRTFLFYFAIAGLVWTPSLVGISTWAGKEVLEAVKAVEGYAVPVLVLLAFGLLFAQKLVVPLFTRRGRRLLYGSFRRKLEWEFWPPQVFYLPVLLQIAWLALRHRSLRMVTAVNPAIPTGGLVGESKWQILCELGLDPDAPGGARGPAAESLPLSLILRYDEARPQQRMQDALAFMQQHGLGFPIIVKPDRGERGRGVEVMRDADQMRQRLQVDPTDLLIQQFVEGSEYGIFYVREPGQSEGRILSINSKSMLTLTGDGKSTLEDLILADDRAVRLAEVHFEYHALRLYDIPDEGEAVHLVEVGAHARGSVFHDARKLATEALRQRLDAIASAMPGFHFGRFDIRVPSEEDLRLGRNLRILELNGLTAEVAHIYDPKSGVIDAWRDVMQQWRIAFRIAAANQRNGAEKSSWGEVLAAWGGARREYRQRELALMRAEVEADPLHHETGKRPATPAPTSG